MTTHTLDMIPSPYKTDTDKWISSDNHTGVVLRMHGKHQGRVSNFTVGFVGLNDTARRTQGGPMLPGPYAYMFANATVIAAHKIADSTQVLEVEEGDRVVINGFEFEIRDDEWLSDPRLRLVKVPAKAKA